jgi:hypothetical protein
VRQALAPLDGVAARRVCVGADCVEALAHEVLAMAW